MKTPSRGRTNLIISLALLSLAIAPALQAQTAYKVSGKSATMTLYGTSTLHDWNMTATVFTGNANLTLTADTKLIGLSALNIDLPVRNLKSKEDGMNDNAYDALKADKNKDIIFKVTSATVTSSGGNK